MIKGKYLNKKIGKVVWAFLGIVLHLANLISFIASYSFIKNADEGPIALFISGIIILWSFGILYVYWIITGIYFVVKYFTYLIKRRSKI